MYIPVGGSFLSTHVTHKPIEHTTKKSMMNTILYSEEFPILHY